MASVPTRVEGRVPPQDLQAETSILGSIMLDPTAITRVLDILKPEDFYRENNGQVFKAALNLFREGEPIDAITMAAELEKLGVLERIGGRAHLALVQESVPTAANVEHYARIVKAKAYKRRLITAGSQVTAFGYEDALDADEAVNEAQATVYAISDDKVGGGMEKLYDLLKPAMDRIDAQMASGGGVIGVPSGFHDLDRMTNGFKAADLVIVAGRPSMGKALALDTPIPTPDGWRTMGDLRAGDTVFDERGVPARVVFATPTMVRRECFEVVFSDGSALVADGDHQWATSDRAARRRGDRSLRVRTTRTIAATLRTPGGLVNHAVPACGALRYAERSLAEDPYALGQRLAAGAVVAAGAFAASAEPRLPRAYLEASVSQRLALLRGLMDEGGRVADRGEAELTLPSAVLADAVAELLAGLGIVAARRDGGLRLRFATGRPTPRRGGGPRRRAVRRIVDVRPVASVPVRCIQVDSPSRLYLAGRACIPTHNTSFVLNVALHAAVDQQKPVAIFSLEMSKEQLVERMLCEQARIDAQRLHRGMLSDVEYERLAGALGPLGDAPIFIDDAPMLDDLTMRLKARQARSREGIEMIVLDYLQLMHGRSRGDDSNRVQEVSAISRALKGIARELKIPVIAISQLSRAPEARPDKRPILSDLRESGCLTASTRLLRADTGAPVSLDELLESGCEGVQVWSMDADRRMMPAPLLRVFPSGTKPVWRLRLASGREVEASGNHRFLAYGGWEHLERLSVGDRVAVPRQVPAPLRTVPWNRDRLALLAQRIGAHCEPRVPDGVFGASDADVAWFLRHLWATNGCVAASATGAPALCYGAAGRRLADDVVLLLGRFGMQTTTVPIGEVGQRREYQVWIRGLDQLRRFASVIGTHGEQGRQLEALVGRLDGARPAAPRELARATSAAVEVGGAIALADDARPLLESPSRDDVYWDRIVGIDPLGEQPVYDGTVDGTHNFIADGIVAHNSIEQDADIVMFLYRDDYYNREKSEKPGMAEVIVAKHRNGPTGVVELVFRRELTRFENLERRRPEVVGPE